jgi:cephalosporin hydroxylase
MPNLATIGQLVQKSEQPLPDSGLEALVSGEPYRRFLYWLVRQTRPAAALELGVDAGQCSALMAAAHAQTLVIGVDSRGLSATATPFQSPNFRFLFCDSLGAVGGVKGILAGRKLGVVFQDSSHHVEPSRLEWRYYQPLLAPDFVWVCDDVTPAFQMPDEPWSMVDYFNELPGHKGLFPGLHRGNAIGVVLP